MSTYVKPYKWEDRVIAVIGLVGTVIFVGYTCYEMGVNDGRLNANLNMWENPPDKAYCVVYPDGGKRCTDKIPPFKMNMTDCFRNCRAQARMFK